MCIKEELLKTASAEGFSQIQLNAIMGSLLGDGCLRASGKTTKALRWNQSQKQHEYNLHKYQLLQEHATKEPQIVPNPGYGDYWSVLTLKSSKTFHLLYELTHPNATKTKTVTQEFLDMIDHPIALAWWYLDDGSRSAGVNGGTIATNGFSQEEVKLLADWLTNRWDIQASIMAVNHSSTKKSAHVLRFNAQPYITLMELIAEFAPESMRYKTEIVTKECLHCGKDIPIGTGAYCSEDCRAQRHKEMTKLYNEHTVDRRRAVAKAWKAANPEKVQASRQRYTEKHKDAILARNREYSKKYHEEHREERNQWKRDWRATHKDDPEYKAKKAAQDKAYREKLKQDPEKLAKARAKKSATAKVRRSTPEGKQRELDQQRAYRAKIKQDPVKYAEYLEKRGAYKLKKKQEALETQQTLS